MKAAILHLHVEDSPVSMTSGHYVTALRQNGQWHLANDEFVRHVQVKECPVVPCGVLFERCAMTSALGKTCCLKEWYVNNTPGLNVFVKHRLFFLVLPTLLKQQQVSMGLNWFSLELSRHTLQVCRMGEKLRGRKEKSLTLRREIVY